MMKAVLSFADPLRSVSRQFVVIVLKVLRNFSTTKILQILAHKFLRLFNFVASK